MPTISRPEPAFSSRISRSFSPSINSQLASQYQEVTQLSVDFRSREDRYDHHSVCVGKPRLLAFQRTSNQVHIFNTGFCKLIQSGIVNGNFHFFGLKIRFLQFITQRMDIQLTLRGSCVSVTGMIRGVSENMKLQLFNARWINSKSNFLVSVSWIEIIKISDILTFWNEYKSVTHNSDRTSTRRELWII